MNHRPIYEWHLQRCLSGLVLGVSLKKVHVESDLCNSRLVGAATYVSTSLQQCASDLDYVVNHPNYKILISFRVLAWMCVFEAA